VITSQRKLAAEGMKTYTVTIADASGDSLVQLTAPDIVEQSTMGAWLFVDNLLVPAHSINETVLDAAQNLRIMPALVGGNEDQCDYDDDD